MTEPDIGRLEEAVAALVRDGEDTFRFDVDAVWTAVAKRLWSDEESGQATEGPSEGS